MQTFSRLTRGLSIATLTVAISYAHAAPTELTQFGAEIAASKDGLIPAYTGGIKDIPSGFKADSGKWVNPFASEQPILEITAQNYQQYSDKMNAGAIELFKRYPNYRMNVYPTHRSASFPDWYLKNSEQNSETAKLEKNGLSVVGAFGGKPFPVPKSGLEALWDWEMRYGGTAQSNRTKIWLVDSSGTPILVSQIKADQYYPYYDTSHEDEFKKKGGAAIWYQIYNDYAAPARMIGATSLFWMPMDMADHDEETWEYNPGQRRVRVAPDLAYDTPEPSYSGAITMDDIFLFFGKMDRWNAKLVGKKEMYIPYNDYKQTYEIPSSKILTPHFVNPDYGRWELHRVWVVELTLKPGARHVYSKKVLYMDEDGGGGMMDAYDQSGKLYRTGFETTVPAYDYKIPYSLPNWFYDFQSGVYIFGNHASESPGVFFNVKFNESYFTPEHMQTSGIR
nr:DUF1329 domain-containing protein [Paraburkholderia nodosa]